MATVQSDRFALLLDGDKVVFREVRVVGRLTETHDSAQYPLAQFREDWPNVKIRGYSEDVELNLRKISAARLPKVLQDINDKVLIRKFMAEDERATAKQHYIKRLEALSDLDGDAGSAG